MPKPKPSAKLRKFLAAYGTINAAAEAWGVEYRSLDRFINHRAGLSLSTAMQIANALSLSVDDLFEQPEAKEAKR
jgi:plasmid maintenance system antidote protein VapI